MTIGKHLLSVNVFREWDGTLEITTAGHSPEFMAEHDALEKKPKRPIDFAERLIVEAAGNLGRRINGGEHPRRFYAAESARGLCIYHDPGPNNLKYPVLFTDPEMPQSKEVMDKVAEILNNFYPASN